MQRGEIYILVGCTFLAGNAGVSSWLMQKGYELNIVVLWGVVEGSVSFVVFGVDLLGCVFGVECLQGCEIVLGWQGEQFVDV